MKHQTDCYRIIGGIRFTNYCDLAMDEEQNTQVIKEAKELYRRVRKIKHADGYYQLFVAIKKA